MYFITTKRMLEVCFSAHPNIQYRTKMGKESTGRMISPFYYQNRYQRFLLIRLNMI